MTKNTTFNNVLPLESSEIILDTLSDICRDGARKMLQAAIEEEVSLYINEHTSQTDANGHRLVVRNGHHPERSIQTGLGDIAIKKPKVNDKRVDSEGNRFHFASSIIPPYLKRSKSMEEFIPWLYLRGISTGDFSNALSSLLGKGAKGISATNIVRLKSVWLDEYKQWNSRDLSDKNYVYIWADGIYPRIRLNKRGSQCFLVILGATPDGKKELITIGEGARESDLSWQEILLSLKKRGLKHSPKIAVGDGALGFWQALSKVFPSTDQQRCWVHKICNVLDKLPRTLHDKAKNLLQEIQLSETRIESEVAFNHFLNTFSQKYERATKCLEKDMEELLVFYNYPAEHWRHLRTTNPIESMFATIRLRTKRTKGHGNAEAALSMAFKLGLCAEKRWNKLSGSKMMADVIDINFNFVDGIKQTAAVF